MSSLLWKAYYDDDLDAFRRVLLAATNPAAPTRVAPGRATSGAGVVGASVIGSPGSFPGSPSLSALKGKSGARAGAAAHGGALTRGEVNGRDASGQTLLHTVASSAADSAVEFAAALIEHPLVDLYLQDHENGWTALHRAFYFGNVTVARMILERDAGDALGKTTGHVHSTVGLVKIKDREGLGPLDLYAATIKDRTLRPETGGRPRAGSHGSEEDRAVMGNSDGEELEITIGSTNINCDQLYTFGSNKNVSLGFGDEDDRQFPERINIRRPEHLLRRFYAEHLDQHEHKWAPHDPNYRRKHSDLSELWIEDIPWMARSRPLTIQDVQMSKLHSAVITTDPECNLYMCGHGQGGRLGVGDERTRFHFVCVEGGALADKRVATVALGLNHTLALSSDGDIFSWGSNGFGQLGYSLPKSTSTDEDPISPLPRQIFGVLKREVVVGIAASRIHSVAHTATSIFTFGKNEGQLGIMDSDARSLEIQVTPRKVGAALFSSGITAVSAMEKATVCLLDNHEVWVFANYGYAKVQFPLDGFTNYFLKQSFLLTSYDKEPNRIIKLTCGGDTICALSSRGEIYTISISQRIENQASSSTTNPSKIKSAIPAPQRIWSPKKSNMAARDVGVDADGSIILSTEEGSVWKRTKRATIKDATAAGTGDYKPKDYKFSRIPGLTRVIAVRASAYGAYAAARRDCDVTQTQIVVDDPTLWQDMFALLALRQSPLGQLAERDREDESRPLFWQEYRRPIKVHRLRRAILQSADVEADLQDLASSIFADSSNTFDAVVCTTTSDVQIPVHRFVLTGRSRVLRRGFRDLCATSTFTVADLAFSELNAEGRLVVRFQGLDILTMLSLVFYLYTDSVIDFWHFTRKAPEMAHRYRTIRTELMKVATRLDLAKLEPATRQMIEPRPSIDMDFEIAFQDPVFFHDGDIIVRLEDEEVRVHSTVVCARCPFFQGLFMGRAGGRWLAGRANEAEITVDLEDINAKTFRLVLRHIYADTGVELFDDVGSVGLDDFLDFVMDVMSAANELMLDRLSQICQQVVGRFVNVRNVCGLLNAISPSSVHEFKDAALEYLCLSLEAMLQSHHLNELDEELLAELDSVVRENQLACMPFAKSGRAEMLLHERHPELANVLDRSRQAKIDAIALRTKFHDLGTFAIGSVEDDVAASPLQHKTRRRSSQVAKGDSDRPALKSRPSTKDMLFAMDEELDEYVRSPTQSPSIRPMSSGRPHESIASSPPPEEVWYDSRGKVLPSPKLGPQQSTTPGMGTPRTPRSPYIAGRTPPNFAQPWSLTPLPGPRTEMKDIMAQAATGRTSTLSQGLASSDQFSPPPNPAAAFSLPAPKMSQKDRKRMQRTSNAPGAGEEVPETPTSSKPARPAAWQTVSSTKTSSIKDILGAARAEPPTESPAARASTPQLTMRQTVANAKPSSPSTRPVIGPGNNATRGTPQRNVSEAKFQASSAPPAPSTNSRPIPQSIRHQPAAEQILGLSMSEIVAAQQLEKDVVREAAAKRDLQEIQAEQEFEEWWRRESARVQEAERRTAVAASAKKMKRPRAGKGKGSGKGTGGGGAGAGLGPIGDGAGRTTDGVKKPATAASAAKRGI